MNKLDELQTLVKFLYNEYVEELFTKETPKYISMCYDVIKHDADERLGRQLTDIEIEYVKLKVQNIINNKKLLETLS